jgi:hypothetical protein
LGGSRYSPRLCPHSFRKADMTREDIEKFIEESGYSEDEILLIDDHDNAFMGLIERCGSVVALYDGDIILNSLADMCGSVAAGEEYFQFNILGAYVGEKTPYILTMRAL